MTSSKTNLSQKKQGVVEEFINKRLVPILQKLSGNKYLRSMMEGFYVTLPIIIFSSLIGLIMWIPPAIQSNWKWNKTTTECLSTMYTFTMGIVTIWFASGIAIAFSKKLDKRLPDDRKMNTIIVGFAGAMAIILLSGVINFDALGNAGTTLNISYLASQGMIMGIVVGLTLPWIFYWCLYWNITIRLPKAVPQGVSQSFADIIPLAFALIPYWLIGFSYMHFSGQTLTQGLFQLIKPLIHSSDSYGALIGIAFATALIWFCGIHGPSVTRPFLVPFMTQNLNDNHQAIIHGGHATHILTYQMSYDFTSTIGGTGATLVIPLLFILFAKSKQAKAVGIASIVPVFFQVNEPLLFGAPMILNPIMLLPFLIIPILNICLFKFFVIDLGMQAQSVAVPWSTPAIFGLYLGTSLDPKAFLLFASFILLDAVLWLPFLLIYDKVLCGQEVTKMEELGAEAPLHYNIVTKWRYHLALLFRTKGSPRYQTCQTQLLLLQDDIALNRQVRQEARTKRRVILTQERLDRKADIKARKINKHLHPVVAIEKVSQKINNKIRNVLILCYGAGTSAMFANSCSEGAKLLGKDKEYRFSASSYGNHRNKMEKSDLVILSPQLRIYKDEILEDAKHYKLQIHNIDAQNYIGLAQKPEGAMEYVEGIWKKNFKSSTE